MCKNLSFVFVISIILFSFAPLCFAQSDSVIATIPVGSNPTALVYNSTDNKIYCAIKGRDSVTIIDGEGDSAIATVGVGDTPYALAYNPTNNKIYCANQYSDDVTIIGGESNSVMSTVSVGDVPRALAYNSTDNTIFCANEGSDFVTVIDGGNNSVSTVNLLYFAWDYFFPRALGYNHTDNKIYCGTSHWNFGTRVAGAVQIINPATDSVVAAVLVNHYAEALAYNPTNNRIYCANQASANVTIIDGAGDTVIATVGVGDWPLALAYNPTNNKIYCANYSNSTVSVIACSPPVAVEEDQETQVIPSFSLKQNYPNPFNPTTSIQYSVGSRQTQAVHGSRFIVHGPIPTTLKIYNILSQKVRTLVDEPKGRGNHEVIWDGKDDKEKEVASGIYFYQLKVGEFSECKKMLLLK